MYNRFNVEYFNSVGQAKSVLWYKVNDDDINTFKELFDINVSKIPLPQYALLCTDTFCKQINDMHEHIILVFLDLSNNSIPVCKPM